MALEFHIPPGLVETKGNNKHLEIQLASSLPFRASHIIRHLKTSPAVSRGFSPSCARSNSISAFVHSPHVLTCQVKERIQA